MHVIILPVIMTGFERLTYSLMKVTGEGTGILSIDEPQSSWYSLLKNEKLSIWRVIKRDMYYRILAAGT